MGVNGIGCVLSLLIRNYESVFSIIVGNMMGWYSLLLLLISMGVMFLKMIVLLKMSVFSGCIFRIFLGLGFRMMSNIFVLCAMDVGLW